MPYLVALALTLVVEAPVYVAALRAARLMAPRRAVLVAIGVNLITHPVVWLVLVRAGSLYWPLFAAVEAAAAVAEAAVLSYLVRRDLALVGLVSLVANTGSCLAGLLLL